MRLTKELEQHIERLETAVRIAQSTIDALRKETDKLNELARMSVTEKELMLAEEIDALRAELKYRSETQFTGYCIICEQRAREGKEKT